MQAVTEGKDWRGSFRRHERLLAAGWLGLLLLGAAALAITPVRVGFLGALQAAVDRWDERWTRRLAAGEALVTKGAYAEAARYLERLDHAFPATDVRHGRDKQRERLLLLLGRSYEALGKKGRAMATYDRLVAFDPLNYHNHFERARAAARLLSGWALAPEARDGYAEVLKLFPSHLPSVRGYVEYYMDRGEFIPVVQAYRDYLDAFLVQRVVVRLGGDSVVALLQVDGLSHEVELPLAAPAGETDTLTIRSGGFAMRVQQITLLPATVVGAMEAGGDVDVPPRPSAVSGFETAGEGALRPTGESSAAAYPLPALPSGIAGVRLRVRLYKPVDDELWQSVEKSFRNLLDENGLAATADRTLPLGPAEFADNVMAHQGWALEGIEARLDDGQ